MTRLFPFEQAILRGIGLALPDAQRHKFSEQLAHINKVQRLLEWNEIEFYCMRWFKVQWPPSILFEDLSEFELGSGTLQASSAVAELKVWSVGGHVFSIESKTPLKPFRTATDASFVLAAVAQPVSTLDGFATR
jgi:hypothetical protein